MLKASRISFEIPSLKIHIAPLQNKEARKPGFGRLKKWSSANALRKSIGLKTFRRMMVMVCADDGF